MDCLDPESITNLPLSWTRTNVDVPDFNRVNLPYSNPAWIPTAEIPQYVSFEQIYQGYLSELPDGFVLQSCNLALRDFLIQQGCETAGMGAEAVLDLPWRGKRSVRELARRGRRHGAVREIEMHPAHQAKLARLMKNSTPRQGKQLKHIERSVFDPTARCFIFMTPGHEWLGAITLSTPAPKYVHTELLLRVQDAPVGVMEALITAIVQQLTSEGIKHFSLGAVTPLPDVESERLFDEHHHPEEKRFLRQLSFRLGRSLKFAFDPQGLWRFKNKFSPRWEPLYLCAYPSLSVVTLAGMLQATGYPGLVWDEIQKRLQISRASWRPSFPWLSRFEGAHGICPGAVLLRSNQKRAWISSGQKCGL